MITTVRSRADAYHDSMLLLAASRALEESPGVSWAAALMGTSANVEALAKQGVQVSDVRANDLVLAVRADSAALADQALDAAEATLAGTIAVSSDAEPTRMRTIAEAATSLPGANIAVVSVPGPFAALAAHHALSAGLHVLLFSDGVSEDDEVALKARAEHEGLLVMGPGAGTAMFSGVGLGFANVVPRGPVGVVAAAGTGAQEVLALLAAAGTGAAAVIGVGGRDLSRAVGGRMTRAALRLLAADPGIEVLLLVSKPPDPQVLADVLPAAGGKPLVVAAIGVETAAGHGVAMARTIDGAVNLALAHLGLPAPLMSSTTVALAARAIDALEPERTTVRGVFSGGTLCYQAMLVLSRRLGPVHSNAPLRPGWDLPAPDGAHVCIDAGEEEYTVSRPHPMIDAAARIGLLQEAGRDPATAVLLFDVVLGYGAHPDPAGVLAPVVADLNGPVVVVHVLGTDADPQSLRDTAPRVRRRRLHRCVERRSGRPAGCGDRESQPDSRRGRAMTRRVALLTYSTRPRGGVVHSLCLAEALHGLGVPVHVIALGDPAVGWFTDVTVPSTIVPAPPWRQTLEERVFAAVDALADALREVASEYDILHAQDCISARSAARVRDAGAPVVVVRTVHHIDDFTTPALVDCQAKAVLEPDRVLVVSRFWQQVLARDHGVAATVVHNGVDVGQVRSATVDIHAGGHQGARWCHRPAAASGRRWGGAAQGQQRALRRVGPPARDARAQPCARRGRRAVVPGSPGLPGPGARPRSAARAGAGRRHRPRRHGRRRGASGVVPRRGPAGVPVGQRGLGSRCARGAGRRAPGRGERHPGVPGIPHRRCRRAMVPALDADALAAAIRAILVDRNLAARLSASGVAVARRYPWSASAEQHRALYRSLTLPRRPAPA